MARKSKLVVIKTGNPDNRDEGKTFLIREMSALQAEKFAARALLALSRSGIDVPDEARASGPEAVVLFGLRAFTRIGFEEAEPLIDEMMQCVHFVPDPSQPNITRKLFDGDIGDDDDEDTSEVTTRLFLRGEVMQLHTGFTMTALLSMGASALKAYIISLTTPTSPEPSEPLSEAD